MFNRVPILQTIFSRHIFYKNVQIKMYLRKPVYQVRLRQGIPWLRFVVANTLAKRKKLEPNEINFSQGFSQKVVSTSCLVLTLCSLVATVDNICKQFGPRTGPT